MIALLQLATVNECVDAQVNEDDTHGTAVASVSTQVALVSDIPDAFRIRFVCKRRV